MTKRYTLTILAGGFGTRLGELGSVTPKGLLNINAETIVSRFIRQIGLKKDDVVIVSNKRFLSQYQALDYFTVDNGVMSASDSRGAASDAQIGLMSLRLSNCNIIAASDNVFSSDAEINGFRESADAIIASGVADVCIATQIVDKSDAPRFGIVTIDSEGFVTSFVEKPSEPRSDIAALALYALSERAAKSLLTLKTSPKDNMGSIIEHLIRLHKCVSIQITNKWFDVGTLQSLSDAQSFFTRDMKHG